MGKRQYVIMHRDEVGTALSRAYTRTLSALHNNQWSVIVKTNNEEFAGTTAMGAQDRQPLRIVPVEGKKALRRFIRLPWGIYADDPVWIPPLLFERRQHFSPRNPYFQHASWKAWLAYRGDRPVGRISAQVDRLYLAHHDDSTGFFGSLEAENDSEIFHALLRAGEDWLREQGLRRIRGPFNLSINQEIGLLVEGFDTPPVFMMGHARPYYGERLLEQGYAQAEDLFAYRIAPEVASSATIMRSVRAKAAGKMSLRPLERSRVDEEMRVLRDIFNDAWSDNWGFVPFTEAEFREMGHGLARIIDDGFVQVAELEGEPAGMIVLLPNLNEIIRDLNGRLLPLGWLKLLWRLKRAYPKSARVALMGVRKRYQNSFQGVVITFMLIDGLIEPAMNRDMVDVEMSWILERNERMWRIIESLGGERYKRYRLYQKDLG